ncbi:MAG TPA: recombinase family protein [Aliarcobacter thereius]|nr:recombinase family protein [Aliarcobacter thereius]HJE02778.1 recombinase family protein [Aliarcobacter thereius]
MLIGYARVSKSDGSQVLDSQFDALKNAGVKEENIYYDKISGTKEQRVGLDNCLKALREDDVLVVYKLDRLGRSLKHLVLTIEELTTRKIGFKVLSGQGVNIDTITPSGKMVFSIFAALAEFERELIIERTKAGLESARARGKVGGRKFALSKSQIRLAEASMKSKDTSVTELCSELNISRATLYKYVSSNGELREHAKKVLEI